MPCTQLKSAALESTCTIIVSVYLCSKDYLRAVLRIFLALWTSQPFWRNQTVLNRVSATDIVFTKKIVLTTYMVNPKKECIQNNVIFFNKMCYINNNLPLLTFSHANKANWMDHIFPKWRKCLASYVLTMLPLSHGQYGDLWFMIISE